ncbi:hypothetical protein C8J55DRAFT_205793 [Lentinula edodes]|uniref:Uncharacterized protein n=1 Tax=Lentinula lateritia TaxID=40482 RepID=A0A9W9DFC7_9AGAR|nr:hypothetical protein C8J55DRAFT_205793 [Lentinula edodes]
MCNLETEGIKYGCGHYVAVGRLTLSTSSPSSSPVSQTRTVNKIDCMRPTCTKSVRHPSNCRSSECAIYYGPARSETITHRTNEFCEHCDYWFKGSRVR